MSKPIKGRLVTGNQGRLRARVKPIAGGVNSTGGNKLPIPHAVTSQTEQKKVLPNLYVNDTNVYLHDPTCLFNFQEHDLAVLSICLEELDSKKTGMTEIARNARQISRSLDDIFLTCNGPEINTGVSLVSTSKGLATGNVFLHECIRNASMKADDLIIKTVFELSEKWRGNKYAKVVLVSRDINLRLRAKSKGIEVEDYLADKTIEDSDVLPPGVIELGSGFLETIVNLNSWKKGAHVFYKAPPRFKLSKTVGVNVNNFITDGETDLQVTNMGSGGIILRTLTDYTSKKNQVYGINARNPRQNYVLNLLMDPDIDFVTLLGQAGTGKTLLTLSAALQQTIVQSLYQEIIITRITIPVGEDIGFLPGNEEEKIAPWMGAFEDNIEVLCRAQKEGASREASRRQSGPAHEWNQVAMEKQIREKIKMRALNFMRGRTFLDKFLIIDEAQNLTPKQMKTLITRAGPGTKVVCLGNLSQIDSPYLSEGSSGLTYAVEKFKGWEHFGSITLLKGERSRLADHANEVM